MDQITIVIREKGKTVKCVFDGSGTCISGDAEAGKKAAAVVSGPAPSAPSKSEEKAPEPAKPADKPKSDSKKKQ